MKKILSLLLVLVMLFGCVSQPTKDTNTSSQDQATKKTDDLLGVSVGSGDQTISESDIPTDTTTDTELDELEKELN
ncbi:MAG: hypothetical protein ABII22_05210 [Candidatus Micrarchaeota archaeon]